MIGRLEAGKNNESHVCATGLVPGRCKTVAREGGEKRGISPVSQKSSLWGG